MSIDEIIVAEMDRYIAAGNQPPDRLYLGIREHEQVRDEARKFGIFAEDMAVNRQPLTYRDMEVFKVDRVRHVGFGSATPSPAG